jgi:hypothetical protein
MTTWTGSSSSRPWTTRGSGPTTIRCVVSTRMRRQDLAMTEHHSIPSSLTTPRADTTQQGKGRGGGRGKRARYGGQSHGGGGRGGGGGGGSTHFVTLQSLRKGRALLATCEVGRERQAAKELRVALERFVEEDRRGKGEGGGSDDDDEEEVAMVAVAADEGGGGGGGGSVREALQQEIAALREAKGAGAVILPVDTVRFDSRVNGLVTIDSTPPADSIKPLPPPPPNTHPQARPPPPRGARARRA